MAAKNKTGKSSRSKTEALVDDLSSQVKKLAKQLKAAEKERDALLQTIDKQTKKAKEALRAVEKKARKELKKAQAAVVPTASKKVSPAKDHAPEASTPAASKPAASKPAASSPASSTPDDSWTVTRLRQAARSRQIAGYSRMNKTQLLSALS